ncbi:MAG: glutamate-1-semialdehyde-2,1-aminomutase [Clostridia bacterium]|nr:glutamate-1-semialdehyde 2,1-aminomutase [Lachnospiraceae bacterium]NCC00296.1 glutamate-1-semialdehyde-2,1-aminomutase [Clostridia bacterium]NCD02320.1 glutamate-1-semialdehyde-2,1-aminomutase [Clostridia bacterium]
MDRSQEIFEKACKLMPGGVSSPVRAYRSVGMTPRFIERAEGSHIYDIDGHDYIDFIGSWGPMILGHANPSVVDAICDAVRRGTSYGAPTAGEVTLCEMIIDAVPSVEMARLVNSGTEAVMSAIRAARGYTGRDYIIKFEGCYHGHADGLLVKAGSGLMTQNVPDSAGVPEAYASKTLTAVYNNLDSVKELFETHGSDIAALIVEPVAANMGVVLPEPGFLEGLREITKEYGAVLIFDEVITGFRLGYSGAQGYYHVIPDMTTMGKIVGGGMPLAVYGGKKEIMEMVSPSGPVYQAGTLSGNPIAVAAGIKTLEILKNHPEIYKQAEAQAEKLEKAFLKNIEKYHLKALCNRCGSLMSLFFTDVPVTNYETAASSDLEAFKMYFKVMLDNGIYIAPSQFEALFVSGIHSDEDIEKTVEAIEKALSQWQN